MGLANKSFCLLSMLLLSFSNGRGQVDTTGRHLQPSSDFIVAAEAGGDVIGLILSKNNWSPLYNFRLMAGRRIFESAFLYGGLEYTQHKRREETGTVNRTGVISSARRSDLSGFLGFSPVNSFFFGIGCTSIKSDPDRIDGNGLSRIAFFTTFGVKSEFDIGDNLSIPFGFYYRNPIERAGYFVTMRAGIARKF